MKTHKKKSRLVAIFIIILFMSAHAFADEAEQETTEGKPSKHIVGGFLTINPYYDSRGRVMTNFSYSTDSSPSLRLFWSSEYL